MTTEVIENFQDKLKTSLKRTREIFEEENYFNEKSQKIKLSLKIKDNYSHVIKQKEEENKKNELIIEDVKDDELSQIINSTQKEITQKNEESNKYALVVRDEKGEVDFEHKTKALILQEKRKEKEEKMKPQFHQSWKLYRVISGHLGWVRTLAVDPSNEFFISGGNDRTLKFWDLASGKLKLTYTGHISTVRGVCISDRHPYAFSCGEDKTVKCWDLQENKTIRSYHGHFSAVYTISIHPTLDLIMTGGRDCSVRVWDIRTKNQVFLLTGHDNTVNHVETQAYDPQVISGSADSCVKLWDLTAGKCKATLTNHKKSVRALAIHPTQYAFATASTDNIKKWKCPKGQFLHNFVGHNKIINSLCINNDNVMVSAADDGSMSFWDWKTGYRFQKLTTINQSGSIDSEKGIFCAKFDQSGSRLITAEADKSIKMYKEDENSTIENYEYEIPNSEEKRY